MRAGVVQVLALEVDLRAAQQARQALGMKNRAGAAHVVSEQLCQLVLEILALGDLGIGGVDVVHGLLEVRRHQLAPVGTEETSSVRHGGEGGRGCHRCAKGVVRNSVLIAASAFLARA